MPAPFDRPAPRPRHGLSRPRHPRSGRARPRRRLRLRSRSFLYAVAKPLFAKVIPEFKKAWKEQTGQEVRFKESYGPPERRPARSSAVSRRTSSRRTSSPW